jgi:predicted nucleotidyltransferase
MRLSPTQIHNIRQAAHQVLGEGASVRLFGSRVHDHLKGGDIDLLFETNNIIPNRADAICRLQGVLMWHFGDRKIDILLKDGRTPDAAIFDVARRTGIEL